MTEVVYILTNEAMPDLVKIGRTEQSVIDRIRKLDTTGVPLPFECFAAYEVADGVSVERAMHTAFGDHRVRERREFFRISPDKPTAILKLVGISNVTPGYEALEEPSDAKALDRARAIRPRFRFAMAGIEVGAVLESVFDDSETCVVLENEKVIFRGAEHSLTSSALLLAREHGKSWEQIQGPRYWKHDDQTLVELRDAGEAP